MPPSADVATHRRLLDAIMAHEAGARAVYADWLEQRGDPRAGFFRLPPDTPELHQRWEDAGGNRMIFRHKVRSYDHAVVGVPTSATVPADAFVASGATLLDTFPSITSIRLHLTERAQVKELAAAPVIARVPSLGFTAENKQARIGNVGVKTFLASAYLGELASLGFDRADVNAPGIASIGKAKLTALRQLSFTNNPIGVKGMTALAATSLALEGLYFESCALDDDAAAALAAWPGLATVQRLTIRYDATIGDAGLVALANSPHVGALRELDITGATFGDETARVFLESPRFGKLAKLVRGGNPERNRVRDEALRRALAERFGAY